MTVSPPKPGINKFQAIKQVMAEAKQTGMAISDLSIGQPSGPALLSARHQAAEFLMNPEDRFHEYQDNTCLPAPDFAERFVQTHVNIELGQFAGQLDFLPIPGIKPMLPVVLMAAVQFSSESLWVYTTTEPGYPTPVDWCNYLKGENGSILRHQALITCSGNQFRFDPQSVTRPGRQLIMMNYPHNPTGQVATRPWLRQLCGHCAKQGYWLFNDAAYAILAHSADHCPLTEVAVEFPELSWTEAFSASKAGNFTGWRVGAMAGSPDMIEAIRTVKGNTDSGFNAPLALGALHAFEHDLKTIKSVQQTYNRRLDNLIAVLSEQGMELAVEPQAGFFSLWQTPRQALGLEIQSAEEFNFRMIQETGVVGVHFEPYIRYAVCHQAADNRLDHIQAAFKQAKVAY